MEICRGVLQRFQQSSPDCAMRIHLKAAFEACKDNPRVMCPKTKSYLYSLGVEQKTVNSGLLFGFAFGLNWKGSEHFRMALRKLCNGLQEDEFVKSGTPEFQRLCMTLKNDLMNDEKARELFGPPSRDSPMSPAAPGDRREIEPTANEKKVEQAFKNVVEAHGNVEDTARDYWSVLVVAFRQLLPGTEIGFDEPHANLAVVSVGQKAHSAMKFFRPMCEGLSEDTRANIAKAFKIRADQDGHHRAQSSHWLLGQCGYVNDSSDVKWLGYLSDRMRTDRGSKKFKSARTGSAVISLLLQMLRETGEDTVSSALAAFVTKNQGSPPSEESASKRSRLGAERNRNKRTSAAASLPGGGSEGDLSKRCRTG